MAFKNGYKIWDEEYEREHWTPEELTVSNEKVARICKIIDTEHSGAISHDEAMIRYLMLDPDWADIMFKDAIHDGNNYEIQQVQGWYDEAKARNQKLKYWGSVVDNAEKTAKEGKNLDVIINLVKKALKTLEVAAQKISENNQGIHSQSYPSVINQ